MKCLECRHSQLIEIGWKRYIGGTIVKCNMCNEIIGEMEDCEDFEDSASRDCTIGGEIDVE